MDEGWTSYAPLDAPEPVCSFCGQRQTPDLRLIASGDGSAAICEECVTRFADAFERWRK